MFVCGELASLWVIANKTRRGGEDKKSLQVITMATNDNGVIEDPRKKLEKIIETLTTSGSPSLDEVDMKKLKKLCK